MAVTRTESTELTLSLVKLAENMIPEEAVLIDRAVKMIDQLEKDLDARFAELIEANRWQRMYREKFEQLRKRTGGARADNNTQSLDNSPEGRRARMAAARDAALATGKVVKA